MPATKSKTPTLDFFDDANCRKQEIDHEISKFLRKRGWKYTCSTPGSYWMWERKLEDGRTALVDTDTAIRFEQELCGEQEFIEE